MPVPPAAASLRLPASFRLRRLIAGVLLTLLAVVEGCNCDDDFDFSLAVPYAPSASFLEQQQHERCTIVGDLFAVRCASCIRLPLENGSFGWGDGENRAPWQGDKARVVEGTTEEITPCYSDRMLRFEATFPQDAADQDDASTVYQVIDLRGVSTLPDPLIGVAQALVNRRRVNNQTDSEFRLTVAAYAGDPSTFVPGSPVHTLLDSNSASILTDTDTATWEGLFNEFSLSVSGLRPDFLLVAVEAVENLIDERGDTPAAVELDAHFADFVRIGIRPFANDLRLAYRALPPRSAQQFVFDLTLFNDTPSPLAATNISVVNEFQGGRFSASGSYAGFYVELQYMDHAGDGVYSPSEGRWTVGRLESGQSARLFVTMRLKTHFGTGFMQTTASIRAEPPDENPGNDRDTTSFSPCFICTGMPPSAIPDTTIVVGDSISIPYTFPIGIPGESVSVSAYAVRPAVAEVRAGPVMTAPTSPTASMTLTVIGRAAGTTPALVLVESSSGFAAIFEVTVVAGNAPPVATDDQATTFAETPVDIAVLANDTDPDGDALAITALSTPDHGTAVLAGIDTLVRYTPEAAFVGADSFTYVVRDVRDGIPMDSARATVTVDVQEVPTGYELGITKTADPPSVFSSGETTFTVTVHNTGPDAAEDVRVEDQLQVFGITLQSVTVSHGTYNAGTGIWQIGTLAGGEDATLEARALIHLTHINTATIVDGLGPDDDPTNNEASVEVTVTQ